MNIKFFLAFAAFLLFFNSIQAKIILPSLITDNMVLQQNQTITIWGWTTETIEKISVCGSWNNDTISTKAFEGKWKVQMHTPSYGGPYTLCIKGHVTKMIQNVMIGEVWLASGQSNMEMPVDSISKGFRGVIDYKIKIAAANFPNIRMFTVSKQTADYPQNNCDGEWQVCNPQTVKRFSAVAYFFAKTLCDNMNVPVGIISSSWGGTNAVTWIKNDELIEQNKRTKQNSGKCPVDPGSLYNSMIYPCKNYTIKGVIWYQGESNKRNVATYTGLMTKLITGWRADWGIEFPFYFTQIAPFTSNDGISSVPVREAQLKTLSVPKTGMAVTSDIGDLDHIHPKQKEEVGRRLAIWALAKDYGKMIVYSGPLYKTMIMDGKSMIIKFDYVESGLLVKGKTLTNFEIAGKDHVFIPAVAKIKGDFVEVYNDKIDLPVAVRFAFSDKAQPNLYNKAGLPASAFRTDDWPLK